MGAYAGPDSAESGLVLSLDAGNLKSYSGSGTTWTDLSGKGNTGTLVNGVGYNSANKGSLVFDGVNDYSETINPLTLHNQNFTLSVWVNPGVQTLALVSMIDFDHATTGSYQGWVLQSEDAITNRYFYLAWYDGTQFQPTGGDGIGAGKGIQITTSVWQNITYVKNGTSLLGYKNGIQVYTGTASNGNVNYITDKDLFIAQICFSVYGPRIFKGNISQVSIYSRAFSAAEIRQNFNAFRGRYGI